jgi:short-subunit dehydrogenase
MPLALIVGASSGIGAELARQLAGLDFDLALVSRREALLSALAAELPSQTRWLSLDISRPDQALPKFRAFLQDLPRVDCLVLNAGISVKHPTWEEEAQTIATNVLGFTALAQCGVNYFIRQGGGHLVGVSSIAAIRGRETSTVYSATKAYVTNYLEGLRKLVVRKRLPIVITEIVPGFVKTPLLEGKTGIFWAAETPQAVRQMVRGIVKKKARVYITRRWRLVAFFLRCLPEWMYLRL